MELINNTRYLRLHFLDNTQMTFSFPQQVEDAFIAGAIRNVQKAPQIVIKTSERIYVFPWTSIKYIEGIPVPNVEIHDSIENAELLSS